MQQAHLPFSYPDAIKVFVAPFFDYLYWLGARCRQSHVHVSFSSTSIQSKSSDWLSLVCKVYELCLKQLVNASKKIMEGQMCLFFRIVFALSLSIQLRNTCGRNLGKKSNVSNQTCKLMFMPFSIIMLWAIPVHLKLKHLVHFGYSLPNIYLEIV